MRSLIIDGSSRRETLHQANREPSYLEQGRNPGSIVWAFEPCQRI